MSLKTATYLAKSLERRSVSCRPVMSAIRSRYQSTSTATNGAISFTNNNSHTAQNSTLHFSESKDFSTARTAVPNSNGMDHYEALLLAYENSVNTASVNAVGSGMNLDLIQAAGAVGDTENFDKVVMLIHHGESQDEVFEKEWVESGYPIGAARNCEDYPKDSLLTGKGVGEILSLSRRTASFFNDETGLIPELFLTSPLRRATQSALVSFPQYAPGSVRNIPWMCHPLCMEQQDTDMCSHVEELTQTFPGIDYDLMRMHNHDNNPEKSELDQKLDLLKTTNLFLGWIKEREERVIVVSSSHSAWLQSLCGFSLRYEPCDDYSRNARVFNNGEMRAVGIKFDE